MPSFSSPRGRGQRRAAFPRGTKGTRGRISRGLLLSWETTSLLWVLNPEPKKSGMRRRGVGRWVGTKVEKKRHLLSSCQFATHLGFMMFPFLSLVFLCFLFFSTISMKCFYNKKNIIISSREREEFPRTHLSGCSALYFLYLSSPQHCRAHATPTPVGPLAGTALVCGGEGGHGCGLRKCPLSSERACIPDGLWPSLHSSQVHRPPLRASPCGMGSFTCLSGSLEPLPPFWGILALFPHP